MKIVFFGNPEFAVPILDTLIQSDHTIVAVVTSPDRPRGRGKKIEPLPVKKFALEQSLSVLQSEKLGDEAFLDKIRELNADAFVVAAFRILPKALFSIPKFGSINVHPSLLPRGRGPAPIRWTLIHGETMTGVTIIQLSEQIDGGAILAQESSAVDSDEDFGHLHDRLAILGAKMLLGVLNKIESGQVLNHIKQDESLITKAPKLYPNDFEMDWKLPAEEIRNRVRAYSPTPGAATHCSGDRFKILSVKICEDREYEPGQLVREGADLYVGTGSSALRLILVKAAGKRVMKTADFLRGRPILPEFLG
jgi:methionyl-tRNA formyltransferase